MKPHESSYDLVAAEHDYPEWRGAPRRTLVIASHLRSGSTLLGEALYAVGGLGNPLEYLHVGFRPAFARRWQADTLDDYVAALHRRRTDTSGTLGIKLFWRDLAETAIEAGACSQLDSGLPPGGQDYAALYVHLQRLLPNPVFVYLYRADRLRAAISAFIAGQTQVFRALTLEDLQRTQQDVAYDYNGILRLLGVQDAAHAHWRAFFAANGLQPQVLTYEALNANYEGTLRGLLQGLGADAHAPLPQPRLTRQSAEYSEALLLRFLRDEAEGRRLPRPPLSRGA